MMAEALVERLGHEVVGVAVNNAIATELVTHARPDVVILDLSLGYNTDFDIIEAAVRVGARVIVFSHTADHAVLDRYSPKPIVVAKPDLHDLEKAIARVQATTSDHGELTADRRQRPAAAAAGPEPSGPRTPTPSTRRSATGSRATPCWRSKRPTGPGSPPPIAQGSPTSSVTPTGSWCRDPR